jgi:VPDSG-CTERM motif
MRRYLASLGMHIALDMVKTLSNKGKALGPKPRTKKDYMKKILLALIVSGLAVASASAYTYLDIETSKTGTFDINNIGLSTNYNPSTQVVYDAYAEFVFLGSGSAQINLAGSTFGKNISLSNGGPIGGNLVGSVLLDLSTDGKISYAVQTDLQTPLQLVSATLKVNAGARVPDGGFTLTLLGLSFLGILVAQRKFASAA